MFLVVCLAGLSVSEFVMHGFSNRGIVQKQKEKKDGAILPRLSLSGLFFKKYAALECLIIRKMIEI